MIEICSLRGAEEEGNGAAEERDGSVMGLMSYNLRMWRV